MSGLMNIASRALSANYVALQTVGNNISNANTPGYSRQEVMFANESGSFSGGGFVGRGVKIQTISRVHEDFLMQEANNAGSQASSSKSRYESLQGLENIFALGDNGLGQAAGAFFNSFVDVSSHPQDPSARRVALARAEDLAVQFRESSTQLQNLQNGVTENLRSKIDTVNTLAQQLATVNQQIARAKGTGHEPNDLLDQRDQLVSQIGEQIQVTTVPADDGTLSVFVAGGHQLVLSNHSSPLTVSTDPANRASLQLTESGNVITLNSSSVGGGAVGGLLQFQNDDLVQARALLTGIANGIVSATNAQQAAGLNLKTPATAGVPMFTQSASDPLNIQVAITDPNDIAASSATATDPRSNNQNALAFVNLRDAALVGSNTVTDAYANAMTDIGTRVQGARIRSEMDDASASQAASTSAASSGVNLDEEAAKLMQFQQSYQAAAKVLQIAQSIFSNVLDIAGR
jgi:flagellar hook-associated protein 1 FlgK